MVYESLLPGIQFPRRITYFLVTVLHYYSLLGKETDLQVWYTGYTRLAG